MSNNEVVMPIPLNTQDPLAHAPAAHAAPASIADGEGLQDDGVVAAERVSYLGFLLGGQVFGLPLEQLREVCKLTRLRRVPGAPAGVAGLVNLRGEIVCALDTSAILGLGSTAPPGGSFFVALRGFPDPLGLVVDAIADIYALDPGEILPNPADWPADRAAYFVGTANVSEGVIGLLDLQRVVRV
jgi:purine-binding chemotaxis protein CheW